MMLFQGVLWLLWGVRALVACPTISVIEVQGFNNYSYAFTPSVNVANDGQTLLLTRGCFYKFSITGQFDVVAHPFQITTTDHWTDAPVLPKGVSAAPVCFGQICTVDFIVPMDAPSDLFWQNDLNPKMFGKIQVSTDSSAAAIPSTTTTTCAPTETPSNTELAPASTMAPADTFSEAMSPVVAGFSTQPECSQNGVSQCEPDGADFITVTPGYDFNFTVLLSCNFTSVAPDWATDNETCHVAFTFDQDGNPIYTIQCEEDLKTEVHGMIQTKWCDINGNYRSFTTQFSAFPTGFATGQPTFPPRNRALMTCSNQSQVSSCRAYGATDITVVAGENHTVSLTLDCPSATCQSRWKCTFESCDVSVDYENINHPIYSIAAPTGSEGRGGVIVTEWCDEDNRYLSFVTNFLVIGPVSNQSVQDAAGVGVLAQGDNITVIQVAESREESREESDNQEAVPPSDPNSQTAGARTTTGAIVGFTILGLAVIATIAGLVFCYFKRPSPKTRGDFVRHLDEVEMPTVYPGPTSVDAKHESV